MMRVKHFMVAAMLTTIPALMQIACAGDVSIMSDSVAVRSSAQHVQIRVNGPGNFSTQRDLNGGSLSFSAASLGIQRDGQYDYEMLEWNEQGSQTVSDPANGRDSAVRKSIASTRKTGSFRVINGAIAVPGMAVEPPHSTKLPAANH